MKELKAELKSYLSHPLTWLIGALFCTLIPLLIHLSWQKNLERLETAAHTLKRRYNWSIQKEEIEKKLIQQLKIADRDYIEKELESLKFLQPEIKKLHLSSDSQPDLSERLQYLESGQNHLHFHEQNFQSLDGFSEVEVIQDHPVELNRDDLKNLLARIENQSIGGQPPDLLIKKFDLLKKPIGANEETFVINLELVKYEMVHE